ncbi:GDSL-like lipase/acylhydrolase family protein [Rhizoctonia solani]|uniref:GDSL-like lipase/acylhydrolase family protein n=1 Tax=Rhizoctonia solani TaxID=456999 RepID=A0A8H8NUK8_9AGAM|nr:GDSL-like lipase/acylhydrolase family protein [Rhizoctonia solani]QRW19610.1 GDSL-like lipase/acylhydrolase family protein [Rhizoctonia solani]
MARRLIWSPTIAILFITNLITIAILISNEVARNAIVDQLSAATLLESQKAEHRFKEDPYFPNPPAPNYVTRTRVFHKVKTSSATITATETATVTATVMATQTVTVTKAVADGLPGFCDECGPEDHICKKYGQHNLERSRAYEGPNTRLRRVLQKAADGHPINIGILGGSVTAGHGVLHPEYWTDIFFNWWNTTFPHEKNVFVNGAVPATTTEYYSVCALEHIDKEVDLVIIEMAINDQRVEVFAQSYEWLVRMLMDLPNKPAVVSAQVIALAFDTITMGGDLHTGVNEYYDIPTVSLRNVVLYHVLENAHLDRDMFHRLPPFQEDSQEDLRHMNRRQICAQSRLKANPSVLEYQSPGNTIPGPEELGVMPRLRMFRKYVRDEREHSVKTSCFSTRSKKHPLKPIRQEGWSEWAWKEKSYLIAKEPGARATFVIDVGPMGLIKITYLKSKTFGLGNVKCWVDNNESSARVIEGWWNEDGLNMSRDAEVAGGVPAGSHEVTCEVLQETRDPGGGHEFRLISLTRDTNISSFPSQEQHPVSIKPGCIPVTVTATKTITSFQTVTPSFPGPAYCDECGKEDLMCKEYGQHNLQRSRGFEGTNSRLKRVLRKAASGEPINIGVIGGSVTHGHAVVHPELWTDIFFEWWNQTYPHEKNVFVNGAVPATGTEYFSVCALEHIDENVDLVIIEMAINDLRNEAAAMTYEWLLRFLLQLPNKPAIISAHVFSIHFEYLATGGDYHLPVSQYYDIPVVNLRHVLLNNVLEHENLVHEIFHARDPYPAEAPDDTRHMNRVGHKMMADLLIAYTQRVVCQMASEDARPIEPFSSDNGLLPTLDTMEQVPRLRLFQHYEPDTRVQQVRSTCMSTRAKNSPFKPSSAIGWFEWAWKEKKYFLAREPGAIVTFDIHVGPMGVVKLEYLRSKTFGLGFIRCWIGEDNGGGVEIDGYWEEDLNIARSSDIVYGHTSGPAKVTCKLLDKTNDPLGRHEFRIIALTSY